MPGLTVSEISERCLTKSSVGSDVATFEMSQTRHTPCFSVAVTARSEPQAVPTTTASAPAPSFWERSSTVLPRGQDPAAPLPPSAQPSCDGSFNALYACAVLL